MSDEKKLTVNAGPGADKMRQQAEEEMKMARNMKRIKHKISVMSGKGGVGKSTVSVNLAMALAMKGKQVGILDMDIHGPNVPKMLGIEGQRLEAVEGGIGPVIVEPGIKVISMAFLLENPDTPVIWRGPLKLSAMKQFLGDVVWGDLDYLIIDLPPGTGDEHMNVAQLLPESEGAVIVTTPQEVALLDSRKSVKFAETLKMPVIGIVENMSGLICPHCGKKIDLFKSGGGEKAAKEMNIKFLGKIPLEPKIVEDSDAGIPFVVENQDSISAKAFNDIAENVLKIVEG